MNPRYVKVDFAQATVNELLTRHRIRMCDIARASGLHDSTVTKIAGGTQRFIERKTAAMLEAGYQAIISGKYEVKQLRVSPEPRRGHPSTWTHCIHGHRYTERNTYIDINGRRRCRVCLARRRANLRAKIKLRELETAHAC